MSIFDTIGKAISSAADYIFGTGAEVATLTPSGVVQGHEGGLAVLGKAASTAALATGITTAATLPVVQTAVVTSATNAITKAPAAAKAVGAAVAQSAVAHPIQTAAAVLIGAPLVAGVISEKPSLVTSLPKTAFQSGQELVQQIEAHPTAAAIIGSVTGGVLAYEGYKALTGSSNSTDISVTAPESPVNSTSVLPSSGSAALPETALSSASSSSKVPITPETQVVGKSAKSSVARRKKRTKLPSGNRQSVRVNIFNANRNIGRYLYKSI